MRNTFETSLHLMSNDNYCLGAMFISSALFPPVVQSHKNILIDLID